MSEPEWISWGPDSPGYPNCPVAPGTDCEVRFAGGLTTRGTMPESFPWRHDGSCGDIIAYRVWPAKDDAPTANPEYFGYRDAPAKDDARALLVEARGYVNDCPASAEPSTERVELLTRIDAYLDRNP